MFRFLAWAWRLADYCPVRKWVGAWEINGDELSGATWVLVAFVSVVRVCFFARTSSLALAMLRRSSLWRMA